MLLIALDARDAEELGAALLGIQHGTADALMAGPDGLFLSNKSKIAQEVRLRAGAVFR